MLDKIREDVLTLAIGDDHANACLRHLACGSVLRVHATTSEGALLWLDILAEVTPWCHFPDEFCRRVIRMGGEDAIDVRKQDQRVCLHHLGDES